MIYFILRIFSIFIPFRKWRHSYIRNIKRWLRPEKPVDNYAELQKHFERFIMDRTAKDDVSEIKRQIEHIATADAVSMATAPCASHGFDKKTFLIPSYTNSEYLIAEKRNLGNEIQTIAVRHAIKSIFQDAEFQLVDMDNAAFYKSAGDLKKTYVLQAWAAYFPSFLPSGQMNGIFAGTHLTPLAQRTIVELVARAPDYFDDKPLGCRDKATLEFCKKHGVPAYLFRCNTLTLPKRKSAPKHGKILINDVPDFLRACIPRHILSNSVEISQLDDVVMPERFAAATTLLEKYRDAKMIITSRIHCASPAVAMGVPVIFLNYHEDQKRRGSFLDGIIPIYSPDDFVGGRVNWNPIAPNIEDLKKLMLRNLELTIKKSWGDAVGDDELNEVRFKIAEYKS